MMSLQPMLSRLWLLFVLVLPSCRGELKVSEGESYGQMDTDGTPVILISIDTLRADRVGAYGYSRPTTPFLDALAKDSVLFEECIAQAPSTLPSHASLFTSRIVSHHGALFSRRHRLPDAAVTMAEILAAEGMTTFGFHDGGQMDPYLGLGQGFDLYELVPQPAMGSEFWRTVARAQRALSERTSNRIFLFLHTYGVHVPYCAEGEFSDLFVGGYAGPLPRCLTMDIVNAIDKKKLPIDSADGRHIANMYDAGIRSVDTSLGVFLALLRNLGLYDRSLIVVTSDHGEELGERGRYALHSHALFDEQIRVPFIMKLPGSNLAGTRVSALVRSIDILPTLLEILGVAAPPFFEGRSALGLAQGENENVPRLAVSERDVTGPALPAAIRSLEWKLELGVKHGQMSLYDLGIDPAEAVDVSTENPEIVTHLDRALAAARSGQSAPLQPEAIRAGLPEQLTRQLRSLGYLSETLEK